MLASITCCGWISLGQEEGEGDDEGEFVIGAPGILLESSDEGVGGVCFIGITSHFLFARDDAVKNVGRSALVS